MPTGESLSRAFAFLALLVGRANGVGLREIATSLGVHYRTAIRYAAAAERAGLVDWTHGDGYNTMSSVKLLNERLRRAK